MAFFSHYAEGASLMSELCQYMLNATMLLLSFTFSDEWGGYKSKLLGLRVKTSLALLFCTESLSLPILAVWLSVFLSFNWVQCKLLCTLLCGSAMLQVCGIDIEHCGMTMSMSMTICVSQLNNFLSIDHYWWIQLVIFYCGCFCWSTML